MEKIIKNIKSDLEMHGGINNFSNVIQMVENVQSLIAANPIYLTSEIPTHLIQQMWMNDFIQMEEEEADDVEMGAETYADYMPAKLKLGRKHPDPVVETASLSSVEPTDIYYKLSIPQDTIQSGQLSALQLEAITYAGQAHDHLLPDGFRAGFLLGDGAGVGKGRTIAGIIYENYLKGRKKAIWISVSNDLKYDAVRDLNDIGAGRIEVFALNKLEYAKINTTINNNIQKGVIFSTYSALIGESNKTRLHQLLQWCGEDFDGCIVFDECHNEKILCPTRSSKLTKTGLTALELQNKLKKARVVYASATGASEPRNMAYMVRLGIWGQGTPFPTFMDFITAVEKCGVGAMELVAMDMKLRGMYIARQLSFNGVTFKIEEVQLSKEFQEIYDKSVQLWVECMHKFTEAAELIDAKNRMKETMWGQFWSAHQRFFKYLCIASKVNHAVVVAREALKMGKCVVIGLQSTGEARTLEQLERDDSELTDFVSTAKGVMQSLVEKHFPAPNCNKMKKLIGIGETTKTTLERIMEEDSTSSALPSGSKRKENSSNLESQKRMKYFLDEDDVDADDFNISDSTCSMGIDGSDGSDEDDFNFRNDSSTDATERVCAMKKELLVKIERLDDKLPPNTLDQLIDELGGPENVAEMAGRTYCKVTLINGSTKYELRSDQNVPLETLTLTEKEAFMNGEKYVAIISEAASSGISLQSDRRVRNQRRRAHITLELSWSADRAIQQFGRTHRSNQVNVPEYMLVITDLAGERRFASTVAKRLESLGALAHGDRRATDTRDLSQFNIDNKYVRSALETVMKSIMGYEAPMVSPPTDYQGDFFKDIAGALVGVGMIVNSKAVPDVLSLDKDYNNVSKFLNRILGMPVDLQNRLFRYFTDTLAAIISDAEKIGRFDLDLGAVTRISVAKFLHKHSTGVAPTELHTVQVERGMNWQAAKDKKADLIGEKEGFYLSHQACNGRFDAILAVAIESRNSSSSSQSSMSKKKDTMFQIYRPNTGLQIRHESLAELEKKYKKVESGVAEQHWIQQYDASENTCSHTYWNGTCRNITTGLDCEVGLRRRTYSVLSGSVFAIWSRVENVLTSSGTDESNEMQVIRFTSEGRKFVGILIAKNCVDKIIQDLSSDQKV